MRDMTHFHVRHYMWHVLLKRIRPNSLNSSWLAWNSTFSTLQNRSFFQVCRANDILALSLNHLLSAWYARLWLAKMVLRIPLSCRSPMEVEEIKCRERMWDRQAPSQADVEQTICRFYVEDSGLGVSSFCRSAIVLHSTRTILRGSGTE